MTIYLPTIRINMYDYIIETKEHFCEINNEDTT